MPLLFYQKILWIMIYYYFTRLLLLLFVILLSFTRRPYGSWHNAGRGRNGIIRSSQNSKWKYTFDFLRLTTSDCSFHFLSHDDLIRLLYIFYMHFIDLCSSSPDDSTTCMCFFICTLILYISIWLRWKLHNYD